MRLVVTALSQEGDTEVPIREWVIVTPRDVNEDEYCRDVDGAITDLVRMWGWGQPGGLQFTIRSPHMEEET